MILVKGGRLLVGRGKENQNVDFAEENRLANGSELAGL